MDDNSSRKENSPSLPRKTMNVTLRNMESFNFLSRSGGLTGSITPRAINNNGNLFHTKVNSNSPSKSTLPNSRSRRSIKHSKVAISVYSKKNLDIAMRHEPEQLDLPGPPSPLENESSFRQFLKRKSERLAEEKRKK